jgi:hypothetical protein
MILLTEKLKFLKEFQEEWPQSHIGGSLGLYLHRIILPRLENKWNNCDLDIVIPFYKNQIITNEGETSNSDFDHYVIKDGIKIEIRISSEPQFVILYHNNIQYNVSKLSDILYWKNKYAQKGINKHIQDLKYLSNLGLYNFKEPNIIKIIDDLPF